MNEYRMILKGTKQNCEDFTIHFTWYHSAAGRITSVVKNDEDGTINLNLLVNEDRKEQIIDWARGYGLKAL